MTKRPNGTYTALDPLIEELYAEGIPPAMIAERLGLDVRGVSKRIFDKGMALTRLERNERVADELIAKYREASSVPKT